jgi:ergothioneine biosynthesis protein EgtB
MIGAELPFPAASLHARHGGPMSALATETERSITTGPSELLAMFSEIRGHTERLCAHLTPEDQCIQSMPDASPAKWHRAHTTWFFEEFVLRPHLPGYRPFDQAFRFLFNSYYETVGARQPRPSRGMITRPSADAVGAYRVAVDAAMQDLIESGLAPADLIRLGLQHEQQHQELLLTDMLHAFAQNPLLPAVLPDWRDAALAADSEMRFVSVEGGIVDIGAVGSGFAFDNEMPRHPALLRPFRIAKRLVRNRDWLEFMRDGGYRTPTLWMAEGWDSVVGQRWEAPLYWREDPDAPGRRRQMGPGGLAELVPEAPVRHVSWYEADAFARWSGARLPTEFEFEHAAARGVLAEATGHVWQWTASAYTPYPGFVPEAGAIGEYNGKFMINQMVLRGSSCATPPGHARPTYRNFFHPDRRWQFAGVRLAKED